jgi:hypothetical protein
MWPAQRFAKATSHVGGDSCYLGMEHEAKGGAKRTGGGGGGHRSGFERAIKIAG